jgi:hypothetical protein
MAFTQFSNGTPIIFGFDDANASALASSIGIRPQTMSISAEPEFTAEAKNEDGETISFVRGADKYSFTLTGFLEDEVLFRSQRSFEFEADGVTRLFIVNSRKIDKSNSDFQKAEIQGMAYPLVTQQD